MRAKNLLPLLLSGLLLLAGCAPAAVEAAPGPKRFEASFLELFDTVTSIVGYADTEEDFRREVEGLKAQLTEYHQLYDIYNDYEGVNNIKTINDSAGIQPVEVDRRIIDLLLLCRDLYEETGGQVNVAMGSVLSLWHEAREAGIEDPEHAKLPDSAALADAMAHTAFENVVIDTEASTVYLTDPQQRLDVGAVAKGYALEQVCRTVTTPMVISLGGNVRDTGPRPDGTDWVVGIQDPDQGGAYLHTLRVKQNSVVTSGDYQRYYTVDGVRFHHIIDPSTGYPADRYRAVTVLCPDSGLADGLSTSLFTMSQEEGEKLLRAHNAEAMWVLADGSAVYSQGFEEHIRT